MDVKVTTTLEEAHVRDACTLFFRARFARRGGAVVQIGHRITVTVIAGFVDDIFEFMLQRFAAFLLA